MTGPTAYRSTSTHTALVLTLVLAGGCSDGGGASTTATPLRLSCSMMGVVVVEFGATLRGQSPFVLGAYFVNEGDQTVIRAPGSSSGCARVLANDLQNLCDQEFGRGPCGTPGKFDACLAAIEVSFAGEPGCAICGDQVCSGDEPRLTYDEDVATWFNVCPEDCACGDGACDPAKGEHLYSCPTDCPGACGDGLCTGFEGCGACDDRPFPVPGCRQCDADCCVTTCGDGVCRQDAGETREGCEQDCALGFCGDGTCMGGERERTCLDCFNGWQWHCLSSACLGEEPCLDVRERCGDGVCMGCEAWTCAADCGRTGFTVCVDNDASCPDKSCGDGVCERPVESAMTCPLDCRWDGEVVNGVCDDWTLLFQPAWCVGDDEHVRCGDGYCAELENPTSCAADCTSTADRCVSTSRCGADGRMCAALRVEGEVTGTLLRQEAVVGCGASCDVVERCRDVCVSDAAGTRCVDCGWVHGELDYDNACARDDTPRCLDASTLSHCVTDPGNPDEDVCRVRRSDPCSDGCVDGACTVTASVPCVGAGCPVCGNGTCDEGETITGCAADCECRASCYFAGGVDELECPAAFAACACGNAFCDAWEQGEAWPCAADCGGP